jgi:hypothetical protein
MQKAARFSQSKTPGRKVRVLVDSEQRDQKRWLKPPRTTLAVKLLPERQAGW